MKKWFVSLEGTDFRGFKVEVKAQDVEAYEPTQAITEIATAHHLKNLTYIHVKEVGRGAW